MRSVITLLIFTLISSTVFAFDHNYTVFDDLLNENVESGRVDYQAIKQNQNKLLSFLDSASKVDSSDFNGWTEKQQIAFLINLYNAATIKLIIDNYPLESIKDIKKPWKYKFIKLFGENVSLDHIEHDILRKKYAEPRIHFAIVCASIGCPPLSSNAYTAEKLESSLDQQAKVFLLQQPEKNIYNPFKNKLYISPIFKWFDEDFENHSGSVLNFIRQYMNKVPEDAKIKYTDYDWSLNSK